MSALSIATQTAPYAVIIDDDPEIRALHKHVLSQIGFQTVLTANAADGVEAVREFNPVVTMLDITIPGMDGFAAARRIREFSDTYLLIVSGMTDEIDVVQGLGAGADDYIFKPFRPREVRARIEAILRRPRTARTVEGPEVPTVESMPSARARAEEVWSPGSPAPGSASAPESVTPAEPEATVPEAPVHPVRAKINGHSPVATIVRAAEKAPAAEPKLAAVSDTPTPKIVSHSLDHPASAERVLHRGSLALHPGQNTVHVEGRSVELHPSEFALLATLVESGRRVRSTANLVLTLRGESYVTTYYVNDADKRAVKAHMTNLCRKLGDTGPAPKWIESVRGVGYRMTAD